MTTNIPGWKIALHFRRNHVWGNGSTLLKWIHEEALADDAAWEKQRDEQRRAFARAIGLKKLPSKRWTKAQHERANGTRSVRE